MNVRTFEV